MLRAIQPKESPERRYVVIDGRSGRTVLAFSGDRFLCNRGLTLLVGICATQAIDIEQLQFMVELPAIEAHVARSSITEMVQEVRGHTPNKKLTKREKEVLSGVLRGLSNKEIASDINLSERTIKFHVSNLLVKFNVSGRVLLSRAAVGAEKELA